MKRFPPATRRQSARSFANDALCGGKGLLNYHVERYGDVAAVIPIDTEQDLMLISQTGILIRIPAAAVRLCVTLRWLP